MNKGKKKDSDSAVHRGESVKLTEPGEIKSFFWLCWLTYFSTYIGRLNFTASLTAMIAAEHFTKAEMGLVGSGFFIGYGVCQLLSGYLGDRLNPRGMIFFGIVGSGILNLVMGCVSDAPVMVVLWVLNGVFQSAVWSPMVRLTAEWLHSAQCVKACVNYATTTPIGTLAAYLLSAGAVAWIGWRASFWSAGVVLLAISLIWLFGTGNLQRKMQASGIAVSQEEALPSAGQMQTGGLRKRNAFTAVMVMIGVAALLHGFLKDSVQTWMPTYLNEVYRLPEVLSIVLTMAVPLANLAGVYLGNWLNQRLFRNELRCSGAFFTAAALLLGAAALSGGRWLAPTLVLFSCAAASMLAVNVLLVTMVPLRLKSLGKVSALTGTLNSLTYVGSAVSSYGGGLLIDGVGWGGTLPVWCALAAVGAVVCVVIAPRWKRQTAALNAEDG